MQIKKLFKYLPIAVIATGLTVAASAPSLSLLNNPDRLKNQIFNSVEVIETDYSDQLEYIRNDVAKQTGVTNSIASIKFVDSTSSANHSAAIVTKTDDSTLLYMWGDNIYGQLGNGTTGNNISTPTLVPSRYLGNKKIIQIVLGGSLSAALLDDGSLYMWGRNDYGQLGNGTTDEKIIPTLVINSDFTSPIIQISLGNRHSAVLLDDGNLHMWGQNDSGQLGSTANSTPNSVPAKVITNFTSKINKIALGDGHSAALLEDGSLYMWGLNDYGQLGFAPNTIPNPVMTQVIIPDSGSEKITQIALGGNHSAALLDDGNLYTWGWNIYGQLGNGTGSDTFTPTKVPINSTSLITKISLGYLHSAALLEDGSLYMWGRNYYGQLGNDLSETIAIPTLVTALSGQKITQIAIGWQHSAAILEDGSLYMWGYNYYGQLGNGTKINTPTPTLPFLGKDSHIIGNSSITAKNAVENVWVDGKFDLTGFMNSFNLINIPDVTDQTFAIDTRPTYDNSTGTVTMNIKIKYFYGENGLIVADTAATPMIIGGFNIPIIEDQFPWWWIIVGLTGASVAGLGVWFFLDKNNAKYGRNHIRIKFKSGKYK